MMHSNLAVIAIVEVDMDTIGVTIHEEMEEEYYQKTDWRVEIDCTYPQMTTGN